MPLGKKIPNFSLENFANLISKNSKVQVILVNSQKSWQTILKNLINDEIIIGMGAGLISQWMRGLKVEL